MSAVALGAVLWVIGGSAASLVVAAGAMAVPWVVGVAEAVGAARRATGPPLPRCRMGGAPPAVLILAAYLPNESQIIAASIRAILDNVDYPGPWRLVVAYNTDRRLPVERTLANLAASHPRLSVMCVADSTTKAENLNAALATTNEEVVGILDADARPEPHALCLAAGWIDGGWDFVQGANLVSAHEACLARAVAAEFAVKYLATYAGRFAKARIAYFAGSNGYWAGDTVRELGFDPHADVEDIDCAVRALLKGCRLGFDARIRCWESAPASWSGLWRQRVRWARGWAQLTGRYAHGLLRAVPLSSCQRAFWLHATTWRRAVTPAAGLVVALSAGGELLRGRPTLPGITLAALVLLSSLAGLAQGVATAHRDDVPNRLLPPPLYAVMYVLAEAARLWASMLVLTRRPPWIATPRPQSPSSP